MLLDAPAFAAMIDAALAHANFDAEGVSVADLIDTIQSGSPPFDVSEDTTVGVLGILATLGIVDLTEGGLVRAHHAKARHTLASLVLFLRESTTATAGAAKDDTEKFLTAITSALERSRLINADMVHEPIHGRRVVTVLFKTRKLRGGVERDVYLHQFHPDWQQYHLIGSGHPDDGREDHEIASDAIEGVLDITRQQYDFDSNFNPDPVIVDHLSPTTGAFTRYEFRVFVARVGADTLPAARDGVMLRWFTVDEIERGKADIGGRIMFSSHGVLDAVQDHNIPVNVTKAPDYGASPLPFKTWLCSRWSWKRLRTIGALLVLAIVTFVLWQLDVKALQRTNNVAGILSLVFLVISGVLTAWPKR